MRNLAPRVAGLTAGLVLAMVAGVVAATSFGDVERQEDDGLLPTVRYAGENRFDTAALVATDESAYAPAFVHDAVVVARGDDFPDALAGSYLAGQLRAPILLTSVGELPDPTSDALFTLGATRAYILGGEAAVSAAVEAELRDTYGLEITRLAGPGRNETAAAIAQFGPVVTEGLEFVRDQGATGVDAGQFSGPTDVTSGPDGTIYVADQLNDRVQAFNATGSFLFEWGEDGDDVGQFNAPVGVATAADGTVFVSEFNAYRVQAFSPGGDFLRTFGSNGPGEDQFASNATGLSVAPNGEVAVGDDAGRILVFAQDGTHLRTLGSPGSGPGQLQSPRGMDHDADGNLWVADRHNNRLVLLSPTGEQLREITQGSDDRALIEPYDVSVGTDGRLFVADRGNGRIQVLLPDGTPIAATDRAGGSAQEMDPIALGIGPAGELLVGDFSSDRLVVFVVAGSDFGLLNGLRTAFLATGERASDALVAGAASARRGLPLLLSSATSLPPATGDALTALGIEQVVIVGGTAAVGDEVAAELGNRGLAVQRIAGPNRVETAIAFALFAVDQLGFRLDHVNLASGGATAFPDTLALGPHAGLERAPILLTGGGAELDAPLQAFFTQSGPCTVQSLHVAGGTAPLSQAIVDGVRAATPYDPGCNPATAPTVPPVPPGGGTEGPEPSEGFGGLTVTAAPTSVVGQELTVTVERAGSSEEVQVEVYRELEPASGTVVRTLVAESRVTLAGGTATLGYTSESPDPHLIVACVVPAGEHCTTGLELEVDPRAVQLRDDVEALAFTTTTWTATLQAPLSGPPLGTDPDAQGVLHASRVDDQLCYGFTGVSGIALPASGATLVAVADGATVATLTPPGADGTSSGCTAADPAALDLLDNTVPEHQFRVEVSGGALAGPVVASSHVPMTSGVASLSGAAISGGAPSPASGFAAISATFSYGFLCSEILLDGVTLPATSAAIHRGGPDGSGPAVVELTQPGAPTGTYGCVGPEQLTAAAAPDEIAMISNDPTGYAVVVTTAEGSLSGPLIRP